MRLVYLYSFKMKIPATLVQRMHIFQPTIKFSFSWILKPLIQELMGSVFKTDFKADIFLPRMFMQSIAPEFSETTGKI